MKKCPFCAEEIQDEAIKCRYCHSDLRTSVPALSTPAAPVTDASTRSTTPPAAERRAGVTSPLKAQTAASPTRPLRWGPFHPLVWFVAFLLLGTVALDYMILDPPGQSTRTATPTSTSKPIAVAPRTQDTRKPVITPSEWDDAFYDRHESVFVTEWATRGGTMRNGMTWDEVLPILTTGVRVDQKRWGDDVFVDKWRIDNADYILTFRRDQGEPYRLSGINFYSGEQ